MSKYRVVQVADDRYIIQQRCFFVWLSEQRSYCTLEGAKEWIHQVNYVNKVVYETGEQE